MSDIVRFAWVSILLALCVVVSIAITGPGMWP
jgi:hypothetical protein